MAIQWPPCAWGCALGSGRKGTLPYTARNFAIRDQSIPFRLQELAQAQEFDVIVSLPCTPGALAELHDFAADPRIRAKILAFLNEKFAGGYSAQSLQSLSTRLAFPLVYYPDETNTQVVYDVTLTTVQRLRELKYLDGGRGTV